MQLQELEIERSADLKILLVRRSARNVKLIIGYCNVERTRCKRKAAEPERDFVSANFATAHVVRIASAELKAAPGWGLVKSRVVDAQRVPEAATACRRKDQTARRPKPVPNGSYVVMSKLPVPDEKGASAPRPRFPNCPQDRHTPGDRIYGSGSHRRRQWNFVVVVAVARFPHTHCFPDQGWRYRRYATFEGEHGVQVWAQRLGTTNPPAAARLHSDFGCRRYVAASGYFGTHSQHRRRRRLTFDCATAAPEKAPNTASAISFFFM